MLCFNIFWAFCALFTHYLVTFGLLVENFCRLVVHFAFVLTLWSQSSSSEEEKRRRKKIAHTIAQAFTHLNVFCIKVYFAYWLTQLLYVSCFRLSKAWAKVVKCVSSSLHQHLAWRQFKCEECRKGANRKKVLKITWHGDSFPLVGDGPGVQTYRRLERGQIGDTVIWMNIMECISNVYLLNVQNLFWHLVGNNDWLRCHRQLARSISSGPMHTSCLMK